MKIADLAARIEPHMKEKNIGRFAAAKPGQIVTVRYDWSGKYDLPKRDAERYLAWLDAGNVGKHYDMEAKR